MIMDTNVPAEIVQSSANTAGARAEEAGGERRSMSTRAIHSKRLSLNFPVLLPSHANGVSHSPNTLTPVSPVRSPPQSATSPVVDAPDFLTLLAGQERKVLELREELGKAENKLLALKKQWASFEASKKKSELRQIAKLQPLPSSTGKGDSETERERHRILEQTSGKPRRHTSQRVFSGSRHARQLSLLTPTTGQRPTIRHSLDESVSSSQYGPRTFPALERADTLPTPTIESPKTLGKTYKELANRDSLPPPSTDAIVRQGKQMANDLKDGLWTFFEDIRQATVGEEAVTGVQGENGRPKMAQRSSNTLHRKKRFSKDNVHNHQPPESRKEDASTEKDTSFWREFGVETPHKHDHSTDRQVSDPLLDLDDEAWDAWESPQQKSDPVPMSIASARPDEQMPWPELTRKLTPAKLSRTVSDIMKEWDSKPNPARIVEQHMSKTSAGQDHYMLASPHM